MKSESPDTGYADFGASYVPMALLDVGHLACIPNNGDGANERMCLLRVAVIDVALDASQDEFWSWEGCPTKAALEVTVSMPNGKPV